MKKILFYLPLFCCLHLSAQNFLWNRAATTVNGMVLETLLDSSGNAYMMGFFEDSILLDPLSGGGWVYSHGSNQDLFVVKYDAGGNFQLGFAVGDTGVENLHDAQIDQAGNIVVTGTFEGIVDFDPGAASYALSTVGGAEAEVFVARYSPAGTFVSAFSFLHASGGISTGAPRIGAFADGSTAVSFSSIGTVDLDPGTGTVMVTSPRIFVLVRVDAAGNYVSSGTIEGEVSVKDLSIDSNGDIVVTGYLRDSADFDTGAGTHWLYSVSTNIFLGKYSGLCNHIWSFNMGPEGLTSHQSAGDRIAIDASDNIVLSGYYHIRFDADPSPAPADTTMIYGLGAPDVFLAKYSPAGSLLWAFGLAAGHTVNVKDMVSDGAGNIYYMIQSFGWNYIDVDPSPATVYPNPVHGSSPILHYSGSGTYLGLYDTFYYTAAAWALDINADHLVAAGHFENDSTSCDSALTPGSKLYASPSGLFLGYFGVSTVGVSEPTSLMNAMIFPSPADPFVEIESDAPLRSLRLLNLAGQVVLEQAASGQHTRLETATLPDGIYFVQLTSAAGQVTRKLVISH